MSSSAVPSPDQAPSQAAPGYDERLLPSPLVWLVAPAVGAGLWLSFSALHNMAGVVIALLGAALVAALLYRASPQVQVRTEANGQRRLHAGTARIEVGYLGRPEALDAAAMRLAMGPELRADAHVCHRPWVHTGVRVEVRDPDDPTPYWLVATRFPAQLSAALADGDPAHDPASD